MTHVTLGQIMTLSLTPLLRAYRRALIKLALRDIEYQLAYIAETRADHLEVERLAHRRCAHLQSELRRLEVK